MLDLREVRSEHTLPVDRLLTAPLHRKQRGAFAGKTAKVGNSDRATRKCVEDDQVKKSQKKADFFGDYVEWDSEYDPDEISDDDDEESEEEEGDVKSESSSDEEAAGVPNGRDKKPPVTYVASTARKSTSELPAYYATLILTIAISKLGRTFRSASKSTCTIPQTLSCLARGAAPASMLADRVHLTRQSRIAASLLQQRLMRCRSTRTVFERSQA